MMLVDFEPPMPLVSGAGLYPPAWPGAKLAAKGCRDCPTLPAPARKCDGWPSRRASLCLGNPHQQGNGCKPCRKFPPKRCKMCIKNTASSRTVLQHFASFFLVYCNIFSIQIKPAHPTKNDIFLVHFSMGASICSVLAALGHLFLWHLLQGKYNIMSYCIKKNEASRRHRSFFLRFDGL